MLFTKEWANEELKFCISELKKADTRWKLRNTIPYVESVRDWVKEEGFWWQASKISEWLKCAKRGGFIIN